MDLLPRTARAYLRLRRARACRQYVNTREHAEAGALMSYGPNFHDLFRRAAEFVDKVLRGAKPADLPVEQPTRSQFHRQSDSG